MSVLGFVTLIALGLVDVDEGVEAHRVASETSIHCRVIVILLDHGEILSVAFLANDCLTSRQTDPLLFIASPGVSLGIRLIVTIASPVAQLVRIVRVVLIAALSE